MRSSLSLKSLRRANVQTQVLRESLRCSLPIEVVYSSKEDMSAEWREKLEVQLRP